ncbi:hypothetical protein SAMN05421858_4748 [Haladaptatus litoreus]|uniref:Uncharacterized protein n=1 Tax=Haladaptatus litoreus TaxID=553468 RepID=A0A1N7F2Q8_9EURY|nr:hypothetical protein SAMN05421858_4748 [Haladaptatus litoreus]
MPATTISGRVSSSAAASVNSWFGPQKMSPSTVTVVSPPDRIAAGGSIGRPVAAHSSRLGMNAANFGGLTTDTSR